MKINSKFTSADIAEDYDTVLFCANYLIRKLEENKLKKADRELLIDAINVLYHIRVNQE